MKSFTENDLGKTALTGTASVTPQSPMYRPLGESSTNTTTSPTEITYQNLHKSELAAVAKSLKPTTPTYENVLTTISITYKSPPISAESSPLKTQADFDSIYEDVTIIPEKAMVPTSTASLPIQQASQPELRGENYLDLLREKDDRPKSLSALDNVVRQKEHMNINLSSSVAYDTNEQLSLFSVDELKTFSSNRSSGSNIQFTPSSTSAPYQFIENTHSPSDLSLSEVMQGSTDNLTESRTSFSFPISSKSMTPNVSPTPLKSDTQSLEDLLTPVSPLETRNTSECSLLQEIQSEVMENAKLRLGDSVGDNLIDFSPLVDEDASLIKDNCESSLKEEVDGVIKDEGEDVDVYQQVKYFRRSINEVNSLLQSAEEEVVQEEPSEIQVSQDVDDVEEKEVEMEQEEEEEVHSFDSLEPHLYENIQGEDMRREELGVVYENVEIKRETDNSDSKDQMSVKDLLMKFGQCKEVENICDQPVEVVEDTKVEEEAPQTEPAKESPTSQRPRKFYEKDSLPPCLRARNLKNQMKTRSLDEEEFKKEFDLDAGSRRKSLEEVGSYKSNSLPKTLNQPKMLPRDAAEGEIESFHMSHVGENGGKDVGDEEEEAKKRERIEKYKEERRKFLQEK